MNETAKKALVKTKFNAEAQHRINDLTNDLAGWQESFDQCDARHRGSAERHQ